MKITSAGVVALFTICLIVGLGFMVLSPIVAEKYHRVNEGHLMAIVSVGLLLWLSFATKKMLKDE